MSTTIGAARVTLHFFDTFSLKEKRGEVKRITQRVSNRFNVGIAEIEDLDDLRIATLGLVVVSTDPNHATRMISTIIRAIEDLVDASSVEEIETELIPF